MMHQIFCSSGVKITMLSAWQLRILHSFSNVCIVIDLFRFRFVIV